MTSGFKKIDFGYASSETEKSRNPSLLLDGFIDFESSSDKAQNGFEYLFLGYKGSGKTAIAQRIELTNTNRHDVFCRNILLGDFPFTPFSKIVRGDNEPEAKYPLAWAWLILLYLIESFSRDSGMIHMRPDLFQASLKALESVGLAPTQDIGALVRKSSKSGFKVSIPSILDVSYDTTNSTDAGNIAGYVESLKRLMQGVTTTSKHLIIIDGLDDIITKRDAQFSALGSLFFEVGRLNEELVSWGVNAKVVVLCRTDLFEKVSNANKNKARQDSAIELDWYSDPRAPESSLLIAAANKRASISLDRDVDVFKEFFPQSIGRDTTEKFLLDMTRHTPRDFLQLMKNIQKNCPDTGPNDNQVKSGARTYSINYFLPEIRDELDGYCLKGEIDGFVNAASKLGKREFFPDEIIMKLRDEKVSSDRSLEILQTLFACSAIGNVQHRPDDRSHYTFKFRNRNSTFNSKERVLLHKGMWKSINLM
jgi:hypothetical protein